MLCESHTLESQPLFNPIIKRLIALWTLVSLLALLAASGPHLVHHLIVPSWEPSYRAHQSFYCLVLLAVSHIPLEEGAPLPCLILPPSKEQVKPALTFSRLPASVHISQARAPPLQRSPGIPVGSFSATSS
jgi:hypothetical protein